MWVQVVGLVVRCLPAFWRVHWWQVVQGAGLPVVFRGVFRPFVPAFLLCLCCVACEIWLYSRFKGVFSVVWGCCVGLCALVLCVACGAFVRV